MTNRIRPATTADIPALFDVRTSVRENHLDLTQLAIRGVTPASIEVSIAGHDERTWVSEQGGTVVAFCMADARTGTVYALFVDPAAEGRGHGRALLRVAEEWLFDAGWETIRLQTGKEPENRAHGFYCAAGWKLIGPSDHDDVTYEKQRAGAA